MATHVIQQGDYLEVKVVAYCRDQVGLNLLHLRCFTVDIVKPSIEQLADDLAPNIAPLFKALMSTDADHRGISVRGVYPLPITTEAVSTINFGAGLVVADVLPLQVTGMLTKRSPFVGPANRGRVYVPFPAESNSDTNGLPTAPYITNLNILGNFLKATYTMAAPFAATTFDWVIFQRALPGFSVNITGFTAQKKFATQRRRGSYGRPNPPPF